MASAMMTSSMRLSLVGAQVDCRMNASQPRTFSWTSTLTSPSLKRLTLARPRSMRSSETTRSAKAGLELPEKIIIWATMSSWLRLRYVAGVAMWLGWQDSNLRMPGSKPGALPLGDTPEES